MCVRFVLLALVLSGAGCLLPSEEWNRESSVGEVVGSIEQGRQEAAVVYLQAIEEQAEHGRSIPAAHVRIEGGRQWPRVGILRPGQALRIENRDPIHHEIVTVGSEAGLEIPLAGGHESEAIELNQQGLVRGYCRLHPRESFEFFVVEADHAVLLEGSSRFRFPGIPVGDYRGVAVGIDGSSQEARISVAADHTTPLDFHLDHLDHVEDSTER